MEDPVLTLWMYNLNSKCLRTEKNTPAPDPPTPQMKASLSDNGQKFNFKTPIGYRVFILRSPLMAKMKPVYMGIESCFKGFENYWTLDRSLKVSSWDLD